MTGSLGGDKGKDEEGRDGQGPKGDRQAKTPWSDGERAGIIPNRGYIKAIRAKATRLQA